MYGTLFLALGVVGSGTPMQAIAHGQGRSRIQNIDADETGRDRMMEYRKAHSDEKTFEGK